MYGFVEKWITEKLGIQAEKYVITEGLECSIVFEDMWNKIHRTLIKLSQNDGFGIIPINSNVRGMKVFLMKYWMDESILYSLTDGDIKNTDAFRTFMDMEMPRFNYASALAVLPDIWRSVNEEFNRGHEPAEILENIIHDEDSTLARPPNITIDCTIYPDDDNKKANEDETNIKEIKEKITLTEKEQKDKQLLKLKQYEIIEDAYHYCFGVPANKRYEHLITTQNNNKILCNLIDLPLTLASKLQEFADTINKGIIITRGVSNKLYAWLRDQTISRIKDHVLILDISPDASHNALLFTNETANSSVYKSAISICFGEKIKKLYLVKGTDINSKIKSIRVNTETTDEAKEDLIKQAIKDKLNSPFYKYDAIFKDTYTNIIFAVKEKNVIHFLFEPSSESKSLFEKCLTEIIRRFNMNISYEELIKIDQEYFKQLEIKNCDEYVEFSITSSKEMYNETLESLKKERTNYQSYFDSMMNSAKLIQRYEDMLRSFDMEKFEKEEKEKARSTYLDALKIEKVSSIYIHEGTIHVFTKNIYAKDSRTKKYHDIGTFHIMIGMLNTNYDDKNTVRIFNTKHLGMGMNGRFQAPHVWEDGHLCHGNLITTMTEAYKKRNLFDLIYQIIIFIETANVSDGAGQCVNTWPEVTEEEALGKTASRDIDFIYKKSEADKKFDAVLAESIPITIKK